MGDLSVHVARVARRRYPAKAVPPLLVPTIQAIADAMGHELSADYRTMTRHAREGELLPEHLVTQLGKPEDH